VFCDAICNQKRGGMLHNFFGAPVGRPSAPRIIRWVGVKDKAAFAAHLDRLAATPGLSKLCFGHGLPVLTDAPATLRSVAEQVRG
jgi:hypothetical protein